MISKLLINKDLGSPDKELSKFINSEISINDIVLDIGSGVKTYQNFKCKNIISLDRWKLVNPDIIVNLEEGVLPFKSNSIDIILLLDVIEHLHKINGLKILDEAKRVVRKEIILLTPTWWDENPSKNVKNSWIYDNPFKYHKSLWTFDEFKDWKKIENIFTTYILVIWKED